jgi:putative transposase
VRRQCELLQVSRSGFYYEPVATSEEDLALMRRMDEIHLEYPFYGSRKLRLALQAEGHEVNRKRVQRLMRVMGLESIAPKPKTSEPHPEHPVYPYLLRGLEISRVNQVWGADISVPQQAA